MYHRNSIYLPTFYTSKYTVLETRDCMTRDYSCSLLQTDSSLIDKLIYLFYFYHSYVFLFPYITHFPPWIIYLTPLCSFLPFIYVVVFPLSI